MNEWKRKKGHKTKKLWNLPLKKKCEETLLSLLDRSKKPCFLKEKEGSPRIW